MKKKKKKRKKNRIDKNMQQGMHTMPQRHPNEVVSTIPLQECVQ